MTPDVAVVFATHNRPQRLRGQLAALRRQTLPHDRFEVIVCDDGSTPETGRVLADETRRFAEAGISFTAVRNEACRGVAAARNRGWRAATAPVIAFTDDDCEAPPQWLDHGLRAVAAAPGSFVQGPVAPIPAELDSYGPFSHTVRVTAMGPGYETANIFYPRAVLEAVGGFDEAVFAWGGEDSDLAWRAIEAGVEPAWAPDAVMHHAVENLGPIHSLRRAWRWNETAMLAFKRHPGMRRGLYLRLFWSPHHLMFVRAAVAALLPRRLWLVRLWLATPYVHYLTNRRSGPLLAPYLILRDGTEVAACLRGSLRYRVIVL